jgi:glycosyltransferase involved in cell wall biosynthesis
VTLRHGVGGLVVPSKIYGILAAGRPTLYVGPEDCEVGEILREGGCGMHVAIGDAAALADAILHYSTDARERNEHGQRARRLFEERFTSDRALAAHRRVLEAVVEGPA